MQLVIARQGLKAAELPGHLFGHGTLSALWSDGLDLSNIIDELVRSGDLVEVEYVLPNISYRSKSFLLPGGTRVRLTETST